MKTARFGDFLCAERISRFLIIVKNGPADPRPTPKSICSRSVGLLCGHVRAEPPAPPKKHTLKMTQVRWAVFHRKKPCQATATTTGKALKPLIG